MKEFNYSLFKNLNYMTNEWYQKSKKVKIDKAFKNSFRYQNSSVNKNSNKNFDLENKTIENWKFHKNIFFTKNKNYNKQNGGYTKIIFLKFLENKNSKVLPIFNDYFSVKYFYTFKKDFYYNLINYFSQIKIEVIIKDSTYLFIYDNQDLLTLIEYLLKSVFINDKFTIKTLNTNSYNKIIEYYIKKIKIIKSYYYLKKKINLKSILIHEKILNINEIFERETDYDSEVFFYNIPYIFSYFYNIFINFIEKKITSCDKFLHSFFALSNTKIFHSIWDNFKEKKLLDFKLKINNDVLEIKHIKSVKFQVQLFLDLLEELSYNDFKVKNSNPNSENIKYFINNIDFAYFCIFYSICGFIYYLKYNFEYFNKINKLNFDMFLYRIILSFINDKGLLRKHIIKRQILITKELKNNEKVKFIKNLLDFVLDNPENYEYLFSLMDEVKNKQNKYINRIKTIEINKVNQDEEYKKWLTMPTRKEKRKLTFNLQEKSSINKLFNNFSQLPSQIKNKIISDLYSKHEELKNN